jgi:hypothetical protein
MCNSDVWVVVMCCNKVYNESTYLSKTPIKSHCMHVTSGINDF